MSSKVLFNKFVNEYCAPVVVVIPTAESETLCQKNGMLLHELFSAFGHLDSINASIKAGQQIVTISDAHIRFERVTELKAKSSNSIEDHLRESFEETDLSRLPSTIQELKISPPSSWTPKLEQLVLRSISFSEFEMISHPVVLLTVVSTSDEDPIACMQELSSVHHTPICLTNGQYDPDVSRVYLILHDPYVAIDIDPLSIQKKFQAKFPHIHTKLLVINSLPPTNPNLQQPDMWSKCILPMYFPQHAPILDENHSSVNSINEERVLGSRLSMEDFMGFREFCVSLYIQDIIPCLERRIITLNKVVSEARKGVKNVLKSFWRKPREESSSPSKGSLRYKSDRIETQILLLADTYFIIKDYEMASSMYRLVKDDYKSDKSYLHLAHTTLMMAACTMITEPGRRELNTQLEQLGQILLNASDQFHANAFFSMLAAEMYVSHQATRAPLDAAQFLLQAASSVPKFPLLCGLLTERAATYFLQAGYIRKYAFHEVLAGYKLFSCGSRPQKHAAMCFSAAMLVFDKGNWGDAKSKLAKSLAENLKERDGDAKQRSLLLLLRVLGVVINDKTYVGGRESMNDAILALKELMGDGPWGTITVGENWSKATIHQSLLGPVPVEQNSRNTTEICGLMIPEIDMKSLTLLQPHNGLSCNIDKKTDLSLIEELLMMLEIEKKWVKEQELLHQTGELSHLLNGQILADSFAEAEQEFQSKFSKGKEVQFIRVPLGERIILKTVLKNKLPIDLSLKNVRLEINSSDSFKVENVSLELPSGTTKSIKLYAEPMSIGTYKADFISWNLSNVLTLRQPLLKEGKLLQKTLEQRMNRVRGENTTMKFEVVEAHPNLHILFEGLSSEVLQGQLLRATLLLRNEGAASACDIHLKLSQPCFVFYIDQNSNPNPDLTLNAGLVPPWGLSSTVVQLPPNTVVKPGEELRLCAWLHISVGGIQHISVISSYSALRNDGTTQTFGPSNKRRSSFVAVETNVLPSVNMSLKIIHRASSTSERFAMVTLANNLPNPINTSDTTRDSSIGQIDLEDIPKNCNEFDDNVCKVEGIWMLGAAHSIENIENRTSNEVISPSEQSSLYLNLKLNEINDIDSSFPGASTWPLPMPVNSGQEDGSSHYLKHVLERFICIHRCSQKLNSLLDKSRIDLQREIDQNAPRSIAQVRRDRQKEENEKAAQSNVIVKSSNINTTFPMNANDFSEMEAHKGNVTIVLIWVCKWQGKLRRGLLISPSVSIDHIDLSSKYLTNSQQMYNLPLASPTASAASLARHRLTSSIKENLSDLLLVAINHPSSIVLGQNLSVTVPVTLQLRSASREILLCCIEAVDKRPLNSSNHSENKLYNAIKGLRWEGKTQYIDLKINPNSIINLNFKANISKAGVFNMKRFNITVSKFSETTKVVQESYIKYLNGQSLLEVMKS